MTHPPTARRAPLPGPLGTLASRAYRWEIDRRNRAYDAGRDVTRLDRPVVSVGNLSVGGTGKTPMVMHVVRELLELARRPCIAMRGYKSRGGESDEQREYLDTFSNVPVVANPDRRSALKQLFASDEGRAIDCVVLDDGFQHRKIARDLDLVLIDATRSPFDDRLVPGGYLREPVESLKRASGVIITHAELAGDLSPLSAQIERVHGRPPLGVTRHVWRELTVRQNKDERAEPVSWLVGKKVVGVCAIGNPDPFMQAIEDAGTSGHAGLKLGDHAHYDDATVRQILQLVRIGEADAIVTTSKDWAKLRRIDPDRWPVPLVVPTLEMAFDSGRDALRDMLADLPTP